MLEHYIFLITYNYYKMYTFINIKNKYSKKLLLFLCLSSLLFSLYLFFPLRHVNNHLFFHRTISLPICVYPTFIFLFLHPVYLVIVSKMANEVCYSSRFYFSNQHFCPKLSSKFLIKCTTK